MEHGIFVPYPHQFRMNWLVTVRHQPVHQIQALLRGIIAHDHLSFRLSALIERRWQYGTFTASVCCEDFAARLVNAFGSSTFRARQSQPGLKLEMRTPATATEKVFLTQSTKETAKDSESGKE